jgi:rhodanese-related sulfurtransferase
MTTPTISRAELRDLLDTDVTIVEALPPEHFDQGHIPGAINLPHTEVRERAAQLLPDKETPIVVYCANLPCPNSEVAATVLTKLGYTNVRRYAEGKDDWREAGLQLERGAPVAG